MRMSPIFIKVHDADDSSIVYRINTNTIDYYRTVYSPEGKTPYTFIHLNRDWYFKVSESVQDIDYLLGVEDDE